MGSATFFFRFGAVLVLASMLSIALGAPVAAGSDRADMAREILDLMRQDRRAEALPLCRAFTDRFPDDPAMLYNLACLENTTGHAEEAAAAFAEAVAAGFDDFALAFRDPDLADLRFHPRMVDLATAHQTRLSRLAADQALSLTWRKSSPPVPLAAEHDHMAADDPTISLTWTPAGLEIELLASGPWSDLAGEDNLAPWNGGSGLVFTLGIPEPGATDDFEISNYFLFAFGVEKGTALGAIHLAGQNRWQVVSEMLPKIRLDDAGHLELQTTIPWASILPYHPLVDERMGFNAVLRLTGQGNLLRASMLPDPAAFRPLSPERRVVPLTFRIDSIDHELFAGKVTTTISGAEPVTFELVALSREEGPGRLTIDFLGGPDQSLLPAGELAGTLDLVPGLNRLTRQADFTALKTGAYLIKAELTFPSGQAVPWGSTVLQLAPGWQQDFQARIDPLSPQEKPTALFHLESIEQAVAAHHPRRGPGAIATTILELDQLLQNAARDGSILPDQGSFLAVYPGPDGENRLCHIYLPPGWRIAARLNPVMTLMGPAGPADAITGRVGQNYEQGKQMPTLKAGSDEGFPVFLAPRLGPADLLAEAEASLEWALETFSAGTASVAGVGQGAGAALRLAVTHPEAMRAMIIFVGGSFEPWPQADASFIREQLVGFPAGLPVTWVDFIRETESAGQGPQILDALKQLECNIVDIPKVRGGLNFTQVADRTVAWAEELR